MSTRHRESTPPQSRSTLTTRVHFSSIKNNTTNKNNIYTYIFVLIRIYILIVYFYAIFIIASTSRVSGVAHSATPASTYVVSGVAPHIQGLPPISLSAHSRLRMTPSYGRRLDLRGCTLPPRCTCVD